MLFSAFYAKSHYYLVRELKTERKEKRKWRANLPRAQVVLEYSRGRLHCSAGRETCRGPVLVRVGLTAAGYVCPLVRTLRSRHPDVVATPLRSEPRVSHTTVQYIPFETPALGSTEHRLYVNVMITSPTLSAARALLSPEHRQARGSSPHSE